MEEQLDDRVDKLNKAGPSSEGSTADLIHLEETLSSAQDKAKKLVTLRLKLDEEATAAASADDDRDGSSRESRRTVADAATPSPDPATPPSTAHPAP